MLGRLRRGARLNELTLACSLGMLALSGLAFVTVPLFLQRFWPDFSVWAALAGSVVGAAVFALAAFVPRRRLRHPGLALASGGAVVTMILLLIAVLAAAFATHLPTMPNRAIALDPHTEAMLRTTRIILAASYSLAAAGFLRRSGQCHDELFGWLAISAVLAVAAHLNYFSVQELAYLLRNIDSLNGAVDKETKAHLRRAAELDMVEVRL